MYMIPFFQSVYAQTHSYNFPFYNLGNFSIYKKYYMKCTYCDYIIGYCNSEQIFASPSYLLVSQQ